MRNLVARPAHHRFFSPDLATGGLYALFVLGGVTGTATSQSPASAHISHEAAGDALATNDSRPVKAVVRALSDSYGWSTDYEDPVRAKHSPDVVDMTDQEYKRSHPSASFIGQKLEMFSTHLGANEAVQTAAPLPTVQRIVGEYNASSSSTRFALRHSLDRRIFVVGVATRTAGGAYQQQPVLLDTPIQLPSATTDLYAALSQVTDALSNISGHHVGLGTVPINLFNGVQCVLPTEKLPARTLLDRLLDYSPLKLAYAFLYDLNEDLYVLNVSVVTRASRNANGVEHRLPVNATR